MKTTFREAERNELKDYKRRPILSESSGRKDEKGREGRKEGIGVRPFCWCQVLFSGSSILESSTKKGTDPEAGQKPGAQVWHLHSLLPASMTLVSCEATR